MENKKSKILAAVVYLSLIVSGLVWFQHLLSRLMAEDNLEEMEHMLKNSPPFRLLFFGMHLLVFSWLYLLLLKQLKIVNIPNAYFIVGFVAFWYALWAYLGFYALMTSGG